MAIILGVNAYHADSSACLVRDGELICAAEEERFKRVKHWAGFPANAIAFCLKDAKTELDQVTHVAINSDPSANLVRRLRYIVFGRPSLGLLTERFLERNRRASIVDEFRTHFPSQNLNARVDRVEHHVAHLMSAFYVSSFRKAVAVSVDGFGDFASAAWGVGDGEDLVVDGRVQFPHSLGIFYMAMTQYLGFPNWGDEYKVMGLAPYGKARYLHQMRKMVRLRDDGAFELELRFFRHHREKVQEWPGSAPQVNDLFTSEVEDMLGPARGPNSPLEQRHKDIARSVQAWYEEAFFHLLNKLHSRYNLDALALAGGCAMNSVANGRVFSRTPFKNMYVQAAAGDAGGAIGAAFHVWQKLGGPRRFVMDHAFWGPKYAHEQIEEFLEKNSSRLHESRCLTTFMSEEEALCQHTARAIADGRVVGWFQGAMEWGPRALGNRSIICDPRRSDMKEALNQKIKHRESFRPFAPSILREAVAEWFEHEDDVPFMMQVYQIRPEKRRLVPAVTHVDGSGRLQTVRRNANQRYYRLIEAFAEITGIPMVLNTSFNENEPVVCEPREALDCFLRTQMDVLVLGNYVVSRSGL